jgi:hypothetical protein
MANGRRGAYDLETAIDRMEEVARASESEDEGLSIEQKEARESGKRRLLAGEPELVLHKESQHCLIPYI